MLRLRLCLLMAGAAVSLAALLPRETAAQSRPTPGTGPTFLYASAEHDTPLLVDAGSIPAMRRRVTLDLRDVSLGEALRVLAEKGRIHFSYSSALIPLALRTTLEAKSITVAAALTEFLIDTNVDVVLSPGDQAMLVMRKPVVYVAPTGVILGSVIDADTRQPISGAMITFDDLNLSGRSRENGTFTISQVPPGSHVVHVRMLGYLGTNRRVEVSNDRITEVSILLQRSPHPLDQVVVTGTVSPTEMRAIPNAMTIITAKEIEQRGITKIDQLFRGDVPGLFAMNQGSGAPLDEVVMFSRGATALTGFSAGTALGTNPIKTYVDGVEMADPQYLNQIDPSTIERIEILPGPQASTIYGSNAINGVMQIFTKRGTTPRPHVTMTMMTGVIQNNFNGALAPNNIADASVSGLEGRLSYSAAGSVNHVGAWTPSKRSTRYSGSSALKFEAGRLMIEGDIRLGVTQNLRGGDIRQVQTSFRELGLVQPNGSAGVQAPQTSTLNGQSLGLTFGYRPTSWWYHEVVVGSDQSNVEIAGNAPGFVNAADTLVSWSLVNEARTSERYMTTAQLPIRDLAMLTLTGGADHWRTRSSSLSGSSTSIQGALGSPTVTRDPPGKNSGAFLQGQLGIRDQLFLTYGLRAEWNPNYGSDAQPNYAPRYGVAYTRDVGPLTAKLRGSYGRSTRPPAIRAKAAVAQTNATNVALYGNYNAQNANPNLGPEFQGGTEGGLELYYGNRAAFTVTRYNQTIDALIGRVSPVDSVKSLAINPQVQDSHDAAGFGYLYITENINVGSIRNQGWELQGTVNLGPLSTRGTYSWTKSRIIGVSAQYRAILGSSVLYQVGRSFDYLPEHTWGLTETYAHGPAVVSLTVNGNGQLYKARDFLLLNQTTAWRDPSYKLRQSLPANYRPLGQSHAMADMTATYSLTSSLQALLQIQNLTNYYQSDLDVTLATIGRQTRAGARLKF